MLRDARRLDGVDCACAGLCAWVRGLEQYERAMQDVRRLLLDNPRFDAANKLKNRLQAAMRRQKDLAACERS